MKCGQCKHSRWIQGSKDNYICSAFPNLIGLVKGSWSSTTDCVGVAETGSATSDILESPEGSSIVLRTFWNDSDPEAGGYWDTTSEPKPRPDEEIIRVCWTSYTTGYTQSLDTGSRYEFFIDSNSGQVVSQSPAYSAGRMCKHQIAIATSFDVRPENPSAYIPF